LPINLTISSRIGKWRGSPSTTKGSLSIN